MKRILWIATFVCVCTFPLVSQDLSLEQALALAKNKSTIAENAALELENQFNETQVNAYLPSITLALGGTATGSFINSDYSANVNPTASIAFSLSNADKYTDDENTLLYKLAQSSYTSTINTLEGQVASAYWNVVAANLALNIQQLAMQNKQASLGRVNERYEGGLATTLEVSEAELSVSNAKVLLQQQQQAVATAKLTLQNLIGETVETTSDDLVEPRALESLEYLNTLALQTSTIQTLKLNVEKAELTYAQTNHTAFSPALSFSASTSFSGEISTTGTQLQDNTTLSVSLSVPLDSYLPNSKAQIDRKNLDNDITIANNNLTHGIETLFASIQQSYSALAQAEATLQYLEEYKAVTDKNFELTQSAYEAGEIPYSSLEDTQNNRSNASLAILQQQVTYTLALYDLSNLLETDINTLFQ